MNRTPGACKAQRAQTLHCTMKKMLQEALWRRARSWYAAASDSPSAELHAPSGLAVVCNERLIRRFGCLEARLGRRLGVLAGMQVLVWVPLRCNQRGMD